MNQIPWGVKQIVVRERPWDETERQDDTLTYGLQLKRVSPLYDAPTLVLLVSESFLVEASKETRGRFQKT